MSAEEAGFKRFMKETREKGLEISALSHVTAEARSVIKDFIEVSNQTERLLESRSDSSADQRILQKKHELLKTEHRELTKRMDKVKDVLTTELAPVLKGLAADANLVGEKGVQYGDPALQEASVRLKLSIKKFIEIFSKL